MKRWFYRGKHHPILPRHVAVDQISARLEREETIDRAQSGDVVTIDGAEFYVWKGVIHTLPAWPTESPTYVVVTPPNGIVNIPALVSE